MQRTEKEVDLLIEKLMASKSPNILQAVSFKKNSPYQMALLKSVLMATDNFSGLVKELLTKELKEDKPPRMAPVKAIQSDPIIEKPSQQEAVIIEKKRLGF